MKKQFGFITIGQSPRIDLVPEMQAILGKEIEIVQTGVLDSLDCSQIASLTPSNNCKENTLVSRLTTGSFVKLDKVKIESLIQERIDYLEGKGIYHILLLCTGKFKKEFKSAIPLLYPQKILYSIVPLLAKKIGVVCPEKDQINYCKTMWAELGCDVSCMNTNPYLGAPEIPEIANMFRDSEVQLCVLDCMGFTEKNKEEMKIHSGLPTILPRTLIARVLKEML